MVSNKKKRGYTIERLFVDKYHLSTDLVARFEITDWASCLHAIHNLNACGFLKSTCLKSLAKDCIAFYAVEKDEFAKYVRFCLDECSPHLKPAFILFPVFYQRTPDSIASVDDVIKAIRWVNRGIATGSDISSVVHRCFTAIIPLAIQFDCMTQLVSECFLSDYAISTRWSLSLSAFAPKVRRQIIDEIRRQFSDDKYAGDLDDDQLPHYLRSRLSNNDECAEPSSENKFDDDSDIGSDFGDGDNAESDEVHSKCVEDLCISLTSNATNSVLTMADVMRELSLQNPDRLDAAATNAPMPRSTIRQFYKSIKAIIQQEAEHSDLEHFKRLLIIQLATHSKKIIDFCRPYLDAYAKRLPSDWYADVNEFFWTHFLQSPHLFRPYAASTAITVLCMRTQLNVDDVATQLCRLSQDKDLERVDEQFDKLLSLVLEYRGVKIDFHSVYRILLDRSKFNWYNSWRAIFEGLFVEINQSIPLSFFKYRDAELFNNALDQLEFILHTKMSLIDYLSRLQFALIPIERVYWIGPPGFDTDPWMKSTSERLITRLRAAHAHCPAYLFKRRIETVLSRFLIVVDFVVQV